MAGNAVSETDPAVEWGLDARKARAAMAGFFLAGLLMSFLGPILPAWGYHLRSDFSTAGLHFLGMALGTVAGTSAAHRLIPRKGLSFTLVAASATACAALLYLSAVSPPLSSWWRFAGVFLVGLGAGLLVSALFHAILPLYRHDPAATVNIAGAVFVLGSLTMALLVAGTFYVYTVPSILFLLALIPGFFAGMFFRNRFDTPVADEELSWRQVWHDFRAPSAVMFALLLFIQFGNEWSVAGWLATFLIQRIGVSPAASLILLAVYWVFLLLGRVLAQALLPRVSHSRMLMASVLAALFGCLVLSFTRTTFGAVFGILFLGSGFATVYPLVTERIRGQFPYFHPSLFSGIFTFALVGGLLAPWTLGYLAGWFGIRVLLLLPAVGTSFVFLLLCLIWLEARLSGREPGKAPRGHAV